MGGKSENNQRLLELLKRISNGERRALEALYLELERPLYRFIYSRLNDSFLSNDLLHDVFIEVWKSAGRFEGRSSAKTWVFGIAFNKVMDVYRKNSKVETVAEIPDVEDDSPSAEQCIVAAQTADHVRNCLGTLKADHRSVIELAFFEDLGYREIAEISAVPEGTVKTRAFHAKKLLMRCLEQRIKIGDE